MMHMFGDQGMGLGYFGMIFMVLFLILAVLGFVYLVKLMAGRDKKNEQEETAEDILKKRYARGEISKEEFDGMKKEL